MYQARIIADSKSTLDGSRITTMMVTYPRIVHAEMMTHRVFSRNSASSRAIPFEKMLKDVEENPFIPIAFQKSHKGMQGTEYLEDHAASVAEEEWLHGLGVATKQAKELHEAGVTKQLCNRLLEPFSWITVLITATEWENFFDLRCPKYEYKGDRYKSWKELEAKIDLEGKFFEAHISGFYNASEIDKLKCNKSGAEIHIQKIAEMMYDAYQESIPEEKKPGEWHLPFSDRIDIEEHHGTFTFSPYEAVRRVCVARCARLSYQTLGKDPEINFHKDLALYNQLYFSRHLSPFEHLAVVPTGDHDEDQQRNFRGWVQYRALVENLLA